MGVRDEGHGAARGDRRGPERGPEREDVRDGVRDGVPDDAPRSAPGDDAPAEDVPGSAPGEDLRGGPTGEAERAASLETIQHELTALARRARATAARTHPELSLVSYTILAHLEDQQDCRATDLAAYYLLDKSTISRQLAALGRLGLIERRGDDADHRVQVLRLAPPGRDLLAAARERRRASVHEGLAQWDPADLARFAGYLVRYNADARP